LRSGITDSVVNYSTANDSALLSYEKGGKNNFKIVLDTNRKIYYKINKFIA